MKNKLLFSILLLFPFSLCHASLFLQHSANYHFSSDNDEVEEFSHKVMRNSFFLGASYERQGRLILGQSGHIWKRSNESTTTGEVQRYDVLELGPRVILFLNRNRNFYTSFSYHFYSKGTRKYGSFEEELKGTSWMATIGMQRSFFGPLFLGFSITYHVFQASESAANQQTLEVQDKHQSIFPSLELSYRFN